MTLPKWIRNKKAIINMKNDDDECFKWSVTRALNPTDKNSVRISKELKRQSEELNWEGIGFLTSPDGIEKFGENNSIGINLIGLSGDKIIALKVAGWKYWRIVTLFFHESRYYVVKDTSRLWSSQISKHEKSRVFCNRCLLSFYSTDGFDRHFTICYPTSTPV
jgi:hypothetical protein